MSRTRGRCMTWRTQLLTGIESWCLVRKGRMYFHISSVLPESDGSATTGSSSAAGEDSDDGDEDTVPTSSSVSPPSSDSSGGWNNWRGDTPAPRDEVESSASSLSTIDSVSSSEVSSSKPASSASSENTVFGAVSYLMSSSEDSSSTLAERGTDSVGLPDGLSTGVTPGLLCDAGLDSPPRGGLDSTVDSFVERPYLNFPIAMSHVSASVLAIRDIRPTIGWQLGRWARPFLLASG